MFKVMTVKKIVLVIVPICLLLIILCILLYPVIKNNGYQKGLVRDIYKNTKIENIEYLNKDNNYYVLISNNEIMVLDLNYEEVFRKKKDEIKSSDMDLVYRKNNLYYEEKIREGKKLIYRFYDVSSLELEDEIKVGG